MDSSRQCSSAIKKLAEDLKAQAKLRSYAFSGPNTLDESQKDQVQNSLEEWVEELEELSETTLQSVLETDAQGAAIYHQVEVIISKARYVRVHPNDSIVNEIARACVPR
jgi:hypothetical protein